MRNCRNWLQDSARLASLAAVAVTGQLLATLGMQVEF